MPSLFPHQAKGAAFLADRKAALLADEQRVGKTAAAIRACDYVCARRILVVTTASARAQWGSEFSTWGYPRCIHVIYSKSDTTHPGNAVVIVSWGMVDALLHKLMSFEWDVLILDESHYAKNPATKRTQAVYGCAQWKGLVAAAERVWCLSGTPYPNSPADAWPMLNALAPERLGGMSYDAFVQRYCVVQPRRIGGRWIDVVKGGKNLDELNGRVAGFWLRRTQQDVGIGQPIFSAFALGVEKLPPELLNDADAQAVFDAVEADTTKALEMHLGPIRRLTGTMKAYAAAEAAAEMLDDGLDKLVLMAWHTDVIDILYTKLAKFHPVGVDGRTPPQKRAEAVAAFREPKHRVFIGQIQAAGEAIDLSAAAELWFVEPSFTPKDMSQAALRITNHSQKRQTLVRVCALAGSIDEAFMAILTRKVASIRQLMESPQQCPSPSP